MITLYLITVSQVFSDREKSEIMEGAWIWLGSSNSKPFKSQFESPTRKFELCTKIEHFNEHIATLKDKCDYATISGLDNIIADFTKSEWDDSMLLANVDKLFKTLDEQRQEGVRILLEPLIPWRKHPEMVKRAGIDVIKNMKKTYPGLLFSPRPSGLRFLQDGVHLDERSGKKMFNATFSASETFFFKSDDDDISGHETCEDDNNISMEIEEISEEIEFLGAKRAKRGRTKETDWSEEIDAGNEPSSLQMHSIHNPAFAKLVQEVKQIRSDMDDRWELDLIVHAGTKEDLDKIENNQNMNKIIISGLEVPEIWLQDNWKGRVAHIKDAISPLFKFIDPDHDYTLGYVKHLNQRLQAARQIVEVTLDTDRHGRGIRKCLAGKIKTWKESGSFPEIMNGVSLAPSLTVATRVRIAILKAIAKIIRSELPNHDAWVIQHAARPVLKVEITLEDNRKAENSYGFAQAIAFMIKELPTRKPSDQDLFDAYTIAGMRFGPEISHYFVLLDYRTAEKIAKERDRKGPKKGNKATQSKSDQSTKTGTKPKQFGKKNDKQQNDRRKSTRQPGMQQPGMPQQGLPKQGSSQGSSKKSY